MLPVTNPLLRSTVLTDLLPFTTYMIMMRARDSRGTSTSATRLVTTTVSLETQLQRSVARADTKDVVIVIMLMAMWVLVIFIFLHRWGEEHHYIAQSIKQNRSLLTRRIKPI